MNPLPWNHHHDSNMTGFAKVDRDAMAEDDIKPGIAEKDKQHYKKIAQQQTVLKQKLRY